MKIDLFKLNNNNHELDCDFTIPEYFYKDTDIRDIKNAHIEGSLSITYEDELYLRAKVTGEFILPCAITLDDVPYKFTSEIDEIIGKFDEMYEKDKNCLDILPKIWENIVSEVPIRVKKEGLKPQNQYGDNWELILDTE